MEVLERIWDILGAVFGGLARGLERGLTSMFGSANARYLKRLQPRVAAINAREPIYQQMTDAELREQTDKFRKRLGELTEYDSETDTRSVLTGDRAALRMDGDLSYLLSGTFGSGGAFSALGQIGISLKSDGTLEFDESEFRAAYAESPDAVKDFLSKEEVGVSARITGLIEQMAGVEGSLITNRTQAIDEKVTSNQERIDSMTERLDAERERLLLEFYRLETTIAKLQASLSALTNIQSVPSILTWGQSD